MAVYLQIICTAILCLICLNMGIMFVWPSSTVMIFSSANTTLHRTMTKGEISLLGSLSSLGAMTSSALSGIFLDKIGRKPCALLAALTAMISWTMIAVSDRVEVILIAMYIFGLSCCAFLINSVFISEICEKTIRGGMISASMVFFNIGMMVSYILGGCLGYNIMVYVNLSLSVIAVLLPFVLMESPLYLLKKGFEKEALQSLAFYRRKKTTSNDVLNELEIMRRALNAEANVTSSEEEKLNTERPKEEKLSKWQFLKKSKSTHRALFVVIVLMIASILQGLPVLQVYAKPLFIEAAPSLSSNLCSIIFAFINVVIGFISAYFTDVAGRRPLLTYGSLAAGFSCLLLGSQIHTNWAPSWFTVFAIYLFSVVYTVGAGTVPFVLIGEVFLPEVKSVVMMVVAELTWICSFLVLLIFNPLVSTIGLGPVFYIFSAICFFTALFGYYCLPETKGLTIDEIQPLFDPKRKKLNSVI